MGLYLRYVAIALRAQMQYRASFIMLGIGQLLITSLEFIAMCALFDRFGSLEGWTLPEVALLYGMANVAFALADTMARGFGVFGDMVKSGDFDRLLLRPRSTAFQVAAGQFELRRLGRGVQGLAVLGWAMLAVDADWTVPRAGLVCFSILGGACTFVGLFVIEATLAFWTTESLELVNTVTYGGVETTQYPIAVYSKWFRRFFIFVIPLACMNYFPALAILDHPDPLGAPEWVPWASPLIGVAFLLVCLRVWRLGERHYRSTGS